MESFDQQDGGAKAHERLSVVLDAALSEHVRVRAFLARTSKSAYVRSLVEEDARRNPASADVALNPLRQTR